MEKHNHFGAKTQNTDSGSETYGPNIGENLNRSNSNVSFRQSRDHYLKRRLRFFKLTLKALRKQQQELKQTIEKIGVGYQQCIQIAANCQEQATKVLNDYHERHALRPAINTVVLLADELFRLYEISTKSHEAPGFNNELQAIEEEVKISASIAQDKLAYLDIEKITPKTGDNIDPWLHIVRGHTDTKEDSMHGKISHVFAPGVVYRGKVLQLAKVSVFRCYKVSDGQFGIQNNFLGE